jgi:alpha-tubulin suppressor-like RCC1 family protein
MREQKQWRRVSWLGGITIGTLILVSACSGQDGGSATITQPSAGTGGISNTQGQAGSTPDLAGNAGQTGSAGQVGTMGGSGQMGQAGGESGQAGQGGNSSQSGSAGAGEGGAGQAGTVGGSGSGGASGSAGQAGSAGQTEVGTISHVVAGLFRTCALFNTGKVRCWGMNDAGQLGYGNTKTIGDNETPASAGNVDIGGSALQITVGDFHTCTLLDTDKVRCWGYNAKGRLGYGNTKTIGDNETPASAGNVDVGGNALQISAGGYHTCALLDSGNVRCWGSGDYGQLGYGNTKTKTIGDDETPASAGNVDVGGKVNQITAGYMHTCALLNTGKVRCWGYAGEGQLGYGNTEWIGYDETPASAGDVDVGGNIIQITAGSSHTCALLDTGKVRCWGYNKYGQLGYGNTDWVGDDETPASAGDVDVGGNVIQITAGYYHTCALLNTGKVRCWGGNQYGQLGYGNTNDIGNDETPASAGDVNVGGKVLQISAGANHTCILLGTGNVRCWGYNVEGQLGYGNTNTIGDDETPASAGDVQVVAP